MKQKFKSVFEGIDFPDPDKIVENLEEVRQMLINGYLESMLGVDQAQNNDILATFFGENFDHVGLREKVEIAVQKMLKGGISLQDAFGIPPEGMEAFYFMGHSMFKQRNYPAARRVFDFLVQLNPLEPKYYHALAATQHRQKDFFSAAQSYINAFVLSPVNNPELHYHAADCYLRMDDLMSSILSLGHCIEGCDDRNELHRQIKARSLTLRETLIQKLQEREQEQAKAQNEQEQARRDGRKMEKETQNAHPSV